MSKAPQLSFVKSHGLGNDFILLRAQPGISAAYWPLLARQLCHRHRGIGADGLIVYHDSQQADARMQVINADGSIPEMCGNGLRTFAHYLHRHHGLSKTLAIETGAGVLQCQLMASEDKAAEVCVEMGVPVLNAVDIPSLGFSRSPVLAMDLDVTRDGLTRTFQVSLVSMGNPHCIVPVSEIPDDWHFWGEALMQHPRFPRQANIEFVVFRHAALAEVKVWERGVGPTEACGTGACAVAVAGQLLGALHAECVVQLPGGDLRIRWAGLNAPVYMTGPSEEVYSGIYVPEGVW
jgi:diaminopimelate epimerase